MNWIKENKFLFGFIIVMVLGIGGCGFLVVTANSRYDEASEIYQQKYSELNRLQRLPTFPNQKNLDVIVGQQTQVNAEVSELAAALAAQQIPVEEITPEVFQDRLKAAVTNVRTKATQGSPVVKLPSEKFFLGFERYETTPPAKEAASALGRELKAIEWLATLLIDNRVAEIRKLERAELPEEQGKVKAKAAKAAATPAPAKGPAGKAAPGKGAPGAKDIEHSVERHRIDLTFIADQSRFRQILNAIVGYQGQFFIPRLISVKNEKLQAPQRAVAAASSPDGVAVDPAAAPAAPVAPGAVPGAPAAPVSSYIVGEEKIETTLVLEMVEFDQTSPAAAPTK